MVIFVTANLIIHIPQMPSEYHRQTERTLRNSTMGKTAAQYINKSLEVLKSFL